MRSTRREFLRRTGAASLTAALAARRAGADEDAAEEAFPLPIVDTHQHLWDLSRLALPWLAHAGPLNRSFLPEDYVEATRGLRVEQAVYMEVDVRPDQHVAEAQAIIELCRRSDFPTTAAVIGGRPGEEGFRDYILTFRDSPFVKGVRQVLFAASAEEPFFLSEIFVSSIRLLGELGMVFDLCVASPLLDRGCELIDACPATRFILDHCGNANVAQFMTAAGRRDGDRDRARQEVEAWRRAVARIAQRDRVVCKISGIVATVPAEGWEPADLAPIVDHCLEVFGPERVMFGSDWPVCTRGASLRRWVDVLAEIVRDRSDREQRLLFAENARRFYGLEGTSSE